jgi:hypothetical protein
VRSKTLNHEEKRVIAVPAPDSALRRQHSSAFIGG